MKIVEKVKLHNFKKFRKIEVFFDKTTNVFIGDNEAGKSSLLLAISLTLSGSKSRVETITLESLLNADVVNDFMQGEKKKEELPSLSIELFLNEQGNPDLNGKNNSDGRICDGLRLICEPIEDYGKEIDEVLSQEQPSFPFEYYSVRFMTFAGEMYTGYRKFLRHLFIDSSQINNEYATREYIKTVYNSNVDNSERNKHQNEYRRHKLAFRDNVLQTLNDRLDDYHFTVRTGGKSNLETDLTISEGEIPIENKGKGRQCFIKTEFALMRKKSEQNLDILLLEEPENHLSHINMKKLIRRISDASNKQIFIATHNNLICSRLDLRKAIMLNSAGVVSAMLKDLPESTANFFIKAPDNNILEFVLSPSVILVEGDAEFLLIEQMYKNQFDEKLENANTHVISVGGTSFKRYLDLAKVLNIKTAVVRDNDGNAEVNCTANYEDYITDNIQIFFEEDNERSTFEICMYEDNKEICDDLFKEGRRTLTVQDYMLKNKADTAFEILDKKADSVIAPDYIKRAISWIRE